MAVIFPPNFSGNVIRFLFDSNGRILSLLIEFHDLFLNVVNIYSPNVVSECKTFFSDLHNYFLLQGLLLVGCDFNCIDNVLDRFNCSIVPSVDKTSLASFCRISRLLMFGENKIRVGFLSLGQIVTVLRPLGSIVFFWLNLFFVKFLAVKYCRVFCQITILLCWMFRLRELLGVILVFGALTIPFCLTLILKLF